MRNTCFYLMKLYLIFLTSVFSAPQSGELNQFARGFGNGAKDLVEAPVQIARHPAQFGATLKQDVIHPKGAGKAIGRSSKDAFKENPAKAAGAAVFDVGGLLIPGVGEGKVALKAVDTAHKAALTRLGVVSGSKGSKQPGAV